MREQVLPLSLFMSEDFEEEKTLEAVSQNIPVTWPKNRNAPRAIRRNKTRERDRGIEREREREREREKVWEREIERKRERLRNRKREKERERELGGGGERERERERKRERERGGGWEQRQRGRPRTQSDIPPVNSLFCPAHGCTNSRFIIAELQIPRTREHVFLGSVWRAHWVQARAQQGRTRSDLTRRALIGFRGQWRGSCHGHKRRTSQSPLSCLLLLLLYCSVALLLERELWQVRSSHSVAGRCPGMAVHSGCEERKNSKVQPSVVRSLEGGRGPQWGDVQDCARRILVCRGEAPPDSPSQSA